MKKSKTSGILLVLGSAVLCVLIVLIMTYGGEKEQMAAVGFIMSGSVEEEGWNGEHYKGIRAACEKFNVELLVKENVSEFSGRCGEAIHELVQEGAGMIVLSSYGYSEEVLDVIKEYPEVVFYSNSSEYHDENLTSYFVRMYQMRYLSGIIAGNESENGKIGYVAAMPNNEVNRGISAFTLGAKRANPDAVVNVIWTGSWDDKESETAAAKTLIEDAGVDVITYHQNQTYVAEVAERAGIDSIGYHVALEEASPHFLTSVVCRWDVLYEELVQTFLQGKSNSVPNFWRGMAEGVVDLAPYSEYVSADTIAMVETAKKELLVSPGVFTGEIYDTEGRKRCENNELISDEMLLEHFDWFVEGVEIYEE